MSFYVNVLIDTTQVEKGVDLVLQDRAYYDSDNVDSYDEEAALRLEAEVYQMINRLISAEGQYSVSKYGLAVVKETSVVEGLEVVIRINVLYNPNGWDVQYDMYRYDVSKKQVIIN